LNADFEFDAAPMGRSASGRRMLDHTGCREDSEGKYNAGKRTFGMNDKKLIIALSELLQTTVDAIFSYQQAVPKVDDDIMRDRLEAFRKSHEEHVRELTQAIARMGGQPPDFSKDFKGYVIEGVAALRSLSGTRGALKALQSAEEMTNRSYSDAVSWEVPDDAHTLLRRQFSDVKIHLDYINSNLKAL
jgi:uncharacterized protein (TIGR02284 family)